MEMNHEENGRKGRKEGGREGHWSEPSNCGRKVLKDVVA